MSEIFCRHFNGYKPCGLHDRCDRDCPKRDIPAVRICLVHLAAVGAVLRSTSLLPAIKRKYPSSHITWITQAPADRLLKTHPLIDRVYDLSFDSLLEIEGREFEIGFVVDKSLKAAGVLESITVDALFGFRKDARAGVVVPANPEAEYLWGLGLDNRKKFFENRKPETQLMVEALGLGEFRRDEYQLNLTREEAAESEARREKWAEGKPLIGINTGCSPMIPYRKFSVEGHRSLIRRLQAAAAGNIVLLGGPEEAELNPRIADGMKGVVSSPLDRGIRDGAVSMNACDIVISGDSFGMHLAIALKKWVVAWFGPTCEQEIDLYGRGRKILSKAGCTPCWKRSCDKETMCYDLVDFGEIVSAVQEGIDWAKKYSSSKPRSSATSCSESLSSAV